MMFSQRFNRVKFHPLLAFRLPPCFTKTLKLCASFVGFDITSFVKDCKKKSFEAFLLFVSNPVLKLELIDTN